MEPCVLWDTFYYMTLLIMDPCLLCNPVYCGTLLIMLNSLLWNYYYYYYYYYCRISDSLTEFNIGLNVKNKLEYYVLFGVFTTVVYSWFTVCFMGSNYWN
jgi:hypothetical protein